MTAPGPSGPARVRLEREFEAPIQEVFAAWTDPRSMERWLSPAGHAEVDADVRVGGRLMVVMVDGDVRIEHHGRYVELEPPRLVSFTWSSPYTGEAPSIVTVTLEDLGASTRLVLVHERLPGEAVEPHGLGWGRILDRLAVQVAGARRRHDAFRQRRVGHGG